MWTDFIFVDKMGAVHPFAATVAQAGTGGCPNRGYVTGWNGFTNIPSADHSGVLLSAVVPNNGSAPTMVVTMPDGSQTSYPFIETYGQNLSYPASVFGDNNGNYLSNSGLLVSIINGGTQQIAVQPNGTPMTYTDTLGNQVLSVQPGELGSDGVESVYGTMTYTYGSGQTAQVVPYNIFHTIQTNFGCSGVGEATIYGYLIDHLTLADGRVYSFTYEPGATAGTTTGRIAGITLPGGGTITYTYATVNGSSINCNTGSPLGLTRIVTDGEGNSSTWTYTEGSAPSPYTNTTTVTDPTGASSIHTFALIIGGLGPSAYGQEQVETSVVAKDPLANVLSMATIQYNGAPTSGSNPTYPITSRVVLTSVPTTAGVTTESEEDFSSLGLPTETAVYDYGASGSGQPGPLLSKTLTSYASLGLEYAHPSTIKTYVGTGTTPNTETSYTYDQTAVLLTNGVPQHTTGYNVGNATTIQRLVGGSTWLTSTYIYNDAGLVVKAIDVNGAVTTNTYNQCGNSLLGNASTPVQVAGVTTVTYVTSQTYNCATATVATSTDVNGNTSTINSYDMFDRPLSSTDPFGNSASSTYPLAGNNQSETTSVFNGGSSASNHFTKYDGLERPILEQTQEGPTSGYWDSISTAYNSVGLVSYTSLPYRTSQGGYTTTGPGIQKLYDGLGRLLTVSDGGGGYTKYTYTGNDVTITKGPAPFTVRVLESDGSGALRSVCEVNGLAGSGACGQLVGATGYLTKYTLVAGQLTVQQNVQPGGTGGIQTRVVHQDSLGRTISESIPELGITGSPGTLTYHFDTDSTGSCPGSYPGDMVYQSDASGNVTCYTYDNQHRMLSSIVVSGPQASVTPQRHFNYDTGSYNGVPFQNALGTTTEAYTCSSGCATKTTDLLANIYPEGSPGAYTGRTVSQVWEYTPASGGYFNASATTFPNGAQASLTVSKYSTNLPSSALLTIGGAERDNIVYPCGNNSCPQTIPDQGLLMVSVAGQQVQIAYNSASTPSSLANALIAGITTSTLPVTAALSTCGQFGCSVQLTSKTTGPGTNYSVGVSSATTLPFYAGTSFPLSTSVSTMVIPSSAVVLPQIAYTIDGQGRPSTLTDSTHSINLVTNVTYNASSIITGITYGNGDSDSYTLDPNTGRVANFSNVIAGTPGFTSTGTPSWNQNGFISSFAWVDGNDATKSHTCTYTADAISRVASVGCGAVWGQTFTYDAFGNITKTGNGGTSYLAHYNEQTNQVLSGAKATYDANGNQTSATFVPVMTWDASQDAISAGSTAMTYDALGRLVEIMGKPVVYGPSGEKLAIFNSDGTYTSSISLPGGGEAYYVSGTLTVIRHKDWLGSSRLATNWSTHTVYAKAAYAPFGEDYLDAGASDLDFTGQTQDSVVGLFDFAARKYDPNAGRWTIPDPSGWDAVDPRNPQSFNRYAYVLNNPMSYTDPFGLDYCDASAINSDCDLPPGTTGNPDPGNPNPDPNPDPGQGNQGIGSVIIFQSGDTRVPWDTGSDDEEDRAISVFQQINQLASEASQLGEDPSALVLFGTAPEKYSVYYWAKYWTVGTCNARGCKPAPTSIKYPFNVTLWEHQQGMKWAGAGDMHGGNTFVDLISPERRWIHQQFSLNGKRIRLFLGLDANRAPIYTYDVLVQTHGTNSSEPPSYSPYEGEPK